MKFIIKLFPEIMVKGTKARKQFIKHLQSNLFTLLRRIDADVQVKYFLDKLEVQTEADEGEIARMRQILVATPGIGFVFQVSPYPLPASDESVFPLIAEKVKQYYASQIENKTFCVRVRRSGNHEFTSIDLERYLGGELNQSVESATVQLKKPEVEVVIELHDKTLNLVTQRLDGLGGFPHGSQDEVLSLMSGGYDSTVSSYMTMRRGSKTHFLFFNLGGSAHEVGVKQVSLFLWHKFGSSSRAKFITVPFEKVVSDILQNVDSSQMGVVLKRSMLKAGELIADEMGIDALVTGESISQVSSQTIRNLSTIDKVTDKLILRPLVTMDKTEIIEIADSIGTADFAKNMPEYCGVISQNPTVRANPKRIRYEESKMSDEILQAAVNERVEMNVDDIIADVNEQQHVEIVKEIRDELVIDIRNDFERAQSPVEFANYEIPFDQLNQKFKNLCPKQDYLLYCSKGVMSQLHALYLQEHGFNNVKVYRP